MIEGRGTKLYAPLQKQNKAAAKTSSQSLALANRQPANQPEHLTANLQNSRENQTATKTTHASPGGVEAWPNSRGSRFHYNFADIPVFHRPIKGLQAKLTVNVPGDAHEQEADRVAEQVMRMPEPQAASMPEVSGRAAGVQRECACGGSCDDCKRKNHNEDHAKVQMKAAGPVNAGGMEAPPIVYEVLRSSGQPLDAGTRSFMEPRFGHDFSKVRVHTDARAAESARAIGARAYTVGSNVVFGEGEYGPGTQAGQRLLGHELAHVVQQSGDASSYIIQRLMLVRQALEPLDQARPLPESVGSEAGTVHTDASRGQNRQRTACTHWIMAEGTCAHLATRSAWICCDKKGTPRPKRSTDTDKEGNPCPDKKFTPLFQCDKHCKDALSIGCSDSDHWMAIPARQFTLAQCGDVFTICAKGKKTTGYVRDGSTTQSSFEVSPGIQTALGVTVGQSFPGAIYLPRASQAAIDADPCCNAKKAT